MIDYNAFHNYLVELVGLYQRTRTTKGMSELARRHHCAAVTKDQFYQMKLDRLTPEQVTPQLSRVIRDTVGKSDAKAVLRESIGALNEGVLAGSRISQGSDRTVQITITQPAPSAAVQPAAAPEKPAAPALPSYKPGWIVYRKGGMMHLVSRLLPNDRFTWNYTLMRGDDGREYIIEENELNSSWLGNDEVRRARGPETARFVGALERDGYTWRVDNPNGLFFVTGRKKARKPERVEVFASDLPEGCRAIHALPALAPSPYRYAMEVESPVDFAFEYMTDRKSASPAQTNAILRQLKQAVGGDVAHGGFDAIRDYYEYAVPSLCSAYGDGSMKEYPVALVKDANNGTSYWLARDRDVLRLLAWVAFII